MAQVTQLKPTGVMGAPYSFIAKAAGMTLASDIYQTIASAVWQVLTGVAQTDVEVRDAYYTATGMRITLHWLDIVYESLEHVGNIVITRDGDRTAVKA